MLAAVLPAHDVDAKTPPPGAAVAVAAAYAQPDGNFIPDSSFESGMQGWSTLHASMSRVSPGHTGDYAVRVLWVDPGITATERTVFTFDYYPGAAPSPMVGEVYTATAWFRGEGQSLGKPVRLALREHNDEATKSPSSENTHIRYSPPVTLTTEWQQALVTKTVILTGMTNVDVFAQMNDAVTGDGFLIDDVYMTGPSKIWIPALLNTVGANGW